MASSVILPIGIGLFLVGFLAGVFVQFVQSAFRAPSAVSASSIVQSVAEWAVLLVGIGLVVRFGLPSG